MSWQAYSRVARQISGYTRFNVYVQELGYVDRGGWMYVGNLLAYFRMDIYTLLAYLSWDKKERHQVAVIADIQEPSDPTHHHSIEDPNFGRFWFSIEGIIYIRALNRHGIPGIDYRRLGSALTCHNAEQISALCHSYGISLHI